MSGLFAEMATFNADISDWNTSRVTDMSRMFAGASSFNQDLGQWDTSAVTSMAGMFKGAANFGKDRKWGAMLDEGLAANIDRSSHGSPKYIGSWDTSHVTDMSGMFEGAASFNAPLTAWDFAEVVSTQAMFKDALAFSGVLVLVAPELLDSSSMFEGAAAFDRPVAAWDTPRVRTTRNMFKGAARFNQPVVDKTDDSKNWVLPPTVEDVSGMFEGAGVFAQDLTSWDLPPKAKRTGMFIGSKVEVPKRPTVGGQTIQPLTAPETPTASEATTGSIKVTWQGVDRATGYVLYYRAAAGAGGKFVDVGGRTEYVVEGLASNTSYTFQVAAKAAGFWDSLLSSEASGKTQPQTFTLRFDSNGGSALADMRVTEGVTAKKPLSKKDGHFLYGWYMDEGFSKAFDFQDVTAPQKQSPPQTLYAKWLDTSGYTVNYSTADNKHYWAKQGDTAITDQTVTLEASGVPSGVSSKIYYNNLDLTITETNSSIGTAPSIPKLASTGETGASEYTAAITLSKPETGNDKPKAKVYGLASRVFIKDAHGEQRPAGKMLAEFYFLNDQKGPALIDLKSKETNDDGNEKAGTQVVSGLFVKRGEHVRMRVKTSSETQQILSPDIKVYDSNEQNADNKWKTMFNFNKLKTNAMYGLKKATDENSDGDQGETRRKGYMTEVVQKSKSTYTEDNSNYSSINVHFEMQGMQKSLPMQLTETLSSNSPNVNFWVLVE